MFGSMGTRNRDQNFGSCWQSLEFGYKSLLVVSLIMVILPIFLGQYVMYLPNIVQYTVQKFQLWRLLTSFLVNGNGLSGFINVLFFYYMLYFTLPDLERKYSTAYVIFEVLLQTLICNLAIVLIGYPLIYFEIMPASQFIGYGVFHLVLVLMFQRASVNPEEPTRFCFFPCLLPMKYIPWCYLLLIVLFGNSLVICGIYGLLGYYQHMISKKTLIQLPLAVYRKFDYWMPESIKAKYGYVKVASVQNQLKQICRERNFCLSAEQDNPFNGNINGMMNDHVEVIGGGVQIGGNNNQSRNPVSFRTHWQKNDDKQEEPVSEFKQQQEQPSLNNNLQDSSTNIIRQHPLNSPLEDQNIMSATALSKPPNH